MYRLMVYGKLCHCPVKFVMNPHSKLLKTAIVFQDNRRDPPLLGYSRRCDFSNDDKVSGKTSMMESDNLNVFL